MNFTGFPFTEDADRIKAFTQLAAQMMFGPKARHALSRWADIIVCDQCGMIEAMEQAGITEKKPLTEWAAVKIPQIGGGRWKR